MASSHGNTHSEAAKMEQIITEFYAKSLHIILESRTPFMSSRNYSGEQALSSPSSSSSSSSSVRPRDKWFNLSLRECPAALENLDLWRQGNLEPMVVNVILVHRPLDRGLVRNLSLKERYPYCWNYEQDEFGCEAKSEKIIERWVVRYDNRKMKDTSLGSRRSSSNTLPTLYKKSMLLLRSLYVTLRLLPAYKVYRDLNASAQIWPFDLTHRVTSLAETFACREEEMQQFGFTPVDTASGRLCISVLYSSSLSDVSSEPSTPMSPQLIPDYVGSPLTDPLKRFPSLPVTGSMVHALQPSSPFSRRHSWSFDHYRASPPSVSFSPSPTYSEPHALISNPSSHRFPPPSLPPHPPQKYLVHNQNTSFDEYRPSAAFSPSLSSATPSLPIFIPESHPSRPLLQSEDTAFSEPTTKPANSPAFSNKINLPRRGIRSGSIKTDKSRSCVQADTAVEKFFLGKDEARQYSGVKISSSSARRSFPDDLDDTEFPCPFDVDDDDVTDPGSRPESFDKKGPLYESYEPGELFPIKKSQDAAVGALVRMLSKAPPLRQDISNSVHLSQACMPETWSNSGQEPVKSSEGQADVQHCNSTNIISCDLIASKTTSDALQELQGYREMKNKLIGQGSKFPM